AHAGIRGQRSRDPPRRLIGSVRHDHLTCVQRVADAHAAAVMCGRVRLSSDYSEIKIRLKFAPNSVAPNFEPDWNKPPTAPMLVAIRSVNGERAPKMVKWGADSPLGEG